VTIRQAHRIAVGFELKEQTETSLTSSQSSLLMTNLIFMDTALRRSSGHLSGRRRIHCATQESKTSSKTCEINVDVYFVCVANFDFNENDSHPLPSLLTRPRPLRFFIAISRNEMKPKGRRFGSTEEIQAESLGVMKLLTQSDFPPWTSRQDCRFKAKGDCFEVY
jgi:hypothetical protein